MRPAPKFAAGILIWGAISAGALAVADEVATPVAPTQGQAVKASPDITREPAPPASVTVIGKTDAQGILGRDVRSTAGENMGRIVDVIVDRSGTVRAAVIDFGGFLGVGSRKIVVDWSALHFGQVTNKKESITLELTLEQVKPAPEYKEGTPIVVLGAAGNLQPLQFDH